ncbi:hypothetical protein ACJ2A9_21805 [Anaerobacillus sp. MEB173]|uniref:hypothetical protein n=1 Tax=Anaerobacillus sp. MEB173 TaxID=3383345 RepID=UPI003F8EACDB
MGKENSYSNLDFLSEVAKKISERSKGGNSISQDEVHDIFKRTLETVTDVRMIESPVFLPIFIEQEKEREGFFIAKCPIYRACGEIGQTEEEAVEKLKKDIDLYNKAIIDTERKMKMEEMIKNVFPKGFL